jgi:sugar/nucleoside kinase (ribokinase family)
MRVELRNTVVGCAGILVSDTFCGPMQELPREGQLLAVDSLPTKAGGCAANVAIDLAKQGIAVEICGCLGNDPSASVLLAGLKAHGVNCERIVYSDTLPTSKTVILLVAGQDRRYIHSFGANAGFKVEHIDRAWVRSLDIFYLGGLFLMPSFDPGKFLELLLFCRAHHVKTVVDVVIPQNTVLPGDLQPLLAAIDYFLPNEDEAERLTGESDPLKQLKTLMSSGIETVMITRGSQGVIAGKLSQSWQAGIYQNVEILDPSGSGDAFAAGVITGVLHQWEIPQILRYASALGASANRALGTTDGVLTADEARRFIRDHKLPIESRAI